MLSIILALCFALCVSSSQSLEGARVSNLLVTNSELFDTDVIPDTLDFGIFTLCDLSFYELNDRDYEAFGYSCGEACSDDSCRSDLHFTSEGMSGEVFHRGVKYIVQPTSSSTSTLTEDKFPLEVSGSRRNLQSRGSQPWHDLCIIFEIGPEVWRAPRWSKQRALEQVLELVHSADDIYRRFGWGIKACGFKFADETRGGTKGGIIDELLEEDPLVRSHGNAYYYIGTPRTIPGGIAILLGMFWGITPYGASMIHDDNIQTLQHEIGHTLGLEHTHVRGIDDCDVCLKHEVPQNPPPNGKKGTVMSYCQHCPGIGRESKLDPDAIAKLTNGAMWAKVIVIIVKHPEVVLEKKGNFCANEGEACDCKGTIYYGADMIWRKQFAETDGLTQCSSNVFGDPYIGEQKSCYCDGEQTRFEFVLKHASKNRCLDNPHGTWWHSDVYTWDCQKGNRNQIWSYDRISGYLRNQDGLCLDAPWRNSNGEELQIYPCTTWWDNANQQFDLAKNGNTWQFKARHGKCVDYPENENGGKVHMWSCNLSNSNQQWILLDPETMQPLRNIPGEQMSETCAFFEEQSGLQCWDYGNRYLKANEQCEGSTCTRADKDRCCKKPKRYECLRKGQCCLLGTTCHGCPGGDEFEWAWNCGGSRRCQRRTHQVGCRKRPGDCVVWGSDSYGCPFGSEQVLPSVCGTSRRCKVAPDNRRSLLDTMLENIEQ